MRKKRLATLLLAVLSESKLCAQSPVFGNNPTGIANRLYSALCLRTDAAGAAYGADDLDLPLWLETTHLLTGASHEQALAVLDEFLRTHGERELPNPLSRALLQRDLWAVFDWSAQSTQDHLHERQQLQLRLAEALRRLALTSQELKSMPDNYSQAVASGKFARQHDANDSARLFLPPDLLQPDGRWVRITNELRPVAEVHAFASSGRSSFLIFIRLPQGRSATLAYLQKLWNAPDPWVGSEIDRAENPALPQFPVGTEVAILRHMNLFDQDGNLVSTPITESVQFRIYRTITSRHDQHRIDVDFPIARSEQDFFEFRLSQAQLLTGAVGGLHAILPDDTEFPTFQTDGRDVLELSAREAALEPRTNILARCVACHSAPGIHSVQSKKVLLKPNRSQVDNEHGRDPNALSPNPWWQYGDTLPSKESQFDWGLLNGYWSLAHLHAYERR